MILYLPDISYLQDRKFYVVIVCVYNNENNENNNNNNNNNIKFSKSYLLSLVNF